VWTDDEPLADRKRVVGCRPRLVHRRCAVGFVLWVAAVSVPVEIDDPVADVLRCSGLMSAAPLG